MIPAHISSFESLHASMPTSQRLLFFEARAAFLRFRTSIGCGARCACDSAFRYLAYDRAQVRSEIFEAHRCELFTLGWSRHRPPLLNSSACTPVCSSLMFTL